MKKISIFILLMLSGTIGILHAQTLTLQDCIQKALRTHPDIKQFILQIRYSKKEINIAQADYLPQISLTAEYDPTRTYVMPANNMFHTRNSDGWQAGATLKQKIWDFSKTSSLIKSRETQEEIANLSLKDARALLAYKVKLQYELAFVQEKAIAVRKKDFQTKEELYEQAKALVAQGLKTSADATRFLSSTSVAKNNLSIAESNFTKAKTVLSLYIGEPVPQGVEFENHRLTPDIYLTNEETMLQNSPSLQSLQKNIEKSELLYKAAKASRYGSLDAVASYSYQDTLNAYNTTVIGVMLNIPLYSGGRLIAQEEQAIIDRESAKNEYEVKVLALKEEFESLLIDLKRYEQTIKAKSSQFKAATQTKNVINGRYQEGLATYIEVLDATALMLDAEIGLLQATYNKNSIIHRLEYLQGMTQ
ncbi:MAG: TolC family protein [Deltaproteobacteria bacterium]|nr:MAG: TolC family protein [Deltaproteobacteria bacterium]